ncbi:MAG: hypothetical protein HY650_02235 [Acidobacteria bacterium]|nr:hypothetical protein [Acidobacteriota bacterium]
MNNLIWYLKQLLPLKYKTVYGNGEGTRWFSTEWRMWLGRCFAVRERIIHECGK